MAKTSIYTEVYVLKITKQQKQTLDKIKERGFVVSKFVRAAIKEKINREHKDLKQKEKKEYCPF
jgi:post-segregation antitoxin (ccd killing protein)